MFHLVTWNHRLGGAGITPGIGKWENVKSVYPLHNNVATRAFLLKWSRQIILREEDLDQIRGLFGEKACSILFEWSGSRLMGVTGCLLFCVCTDIHYCPCLSICFRHPGLVFLTWLFSYVRYRDLSLVHYFSRILETERGWLKLTMVCQGCGVSQGKPGSV